MRHKSGPMALFADDECERELEEVHALGRAKGKGKSKRRGNSKVPSKGYGKTMEKTGRQGGAELEVGAGRSRRLYIQVPQCGLEGHKAMHRGEDKGQVRGKKHVYSVDDEAVEDTEP